MKSQRTAAAIGSPKTMIIMLDQVMTASAPVFPGESSKSGFQTSKPS
jgi:hypothetical protein